MYGVFWIQKSKLDQMKQLSVLLDLKQSHRITAKEEYGFYVLNLLHNILIGSLSLEA